MSSCVLWTGNVSPAGYGRVSSPRGNLYAHRLVYEALHGAIPEGHHIHHTCGTKLCVNQEHLELVAAGEHIRSHHQQRTHFRNGHPFTPENTYVHPRQPYSYRVCRICTRDAGRRYYERTK